MKEIFSEANILYMYKISSNFDKDFGRQWYRDANEKCVTIASNLELPITKVVGVVAALSPMNKWNNNLKDAFNICYAFKQGKDIETVKVRTFGQNKYKAGMILEYGNNNDAILKLLAGRKITSFYDNILNCEHSQRITIDGHAFNIACGTRSALSKVKGLTDLTYKKIEDKYRNAAQSIGEYPLHLQAITWLTYRRSLSGQLSMF